MSRMSLLPSPNNNNNSNASDDLVRSSGDSVHSYHSAGTASSANKNSLSRPPGLGGGPPPIGKPGHVKSASNASTTAQTATLTPTSSLDGGANNAGDLYSVGLGVRHQVSSPSSSDHLPGIGNLGSFDTADSGDHDGLLGLQALRDRAHSSPGPMAGTGTYSTSPRDIGGVRGVISSQQARPRTVSKDSGRSQSIGSRPPLAGGSAMSPHPSDGLSGYSGARSRDASPPPNAGVISRPYSPYGSGGSTAGGGSELESSLRRALSSDSSAASEYGSVPGSGGDHLSSKFSAPLPLTSHSRTSSGGSLHGQQGQGGMYHQRAQRSHSQPGPARGMPNQDYYQEDVGAGGGSRRSSDYNVPPSVSGYHVPPPHRGGVAPGMENEYQYHEQDMRYGSGGGGHPHQHNRSMSMQHNAGNAGYHDHHRRASGGYFSRSMRDMEYDDGRRYQEHDRIGNAGYPRQDRLVSPAHSPMHAQYGSHSRANSDMGSTMTSSPMSLSASGQQQPLYGRHRMNHSDDDLSHPLVGENIEVPGEEQYYDQGMMPYPRAASIGHPPSHGGESNYLPSAGPPFSAPKDAYNVKFKRTQKVYEIGPRLNRDLKVGTYVKVEADRGEDLGIIVGKVKSPSALRSTSFSGAMGDLPSGPGSDTKKIIRLATHDEVSLLQMKREEEEDLLKVCRTKVRQRALPMHVVDAEYQFDRHKLTFFFEAEGRIDFRELVRDLFSMYKTRIWMQQLDKSIAATCPAAPAPAPLVMDFGTPIIAPASEYEDFAGPNGPPDDQAH
ncbi:MAG: hypothetical protein SGILL_002801 [Bacillariaceae sp.]